MLNREYLGCAKEYKTSSGGGRGGSNSGSNRASNGISLSCVGCGLGVVVVSS